MCPLSVLTTAVLTIVTVTAIAYPSAAERKNTGSIAGQVVGSRCGEPIPYTQVFVDGKAVGAFLDGGVFRIESLPAGEHVIEAHAPEALPSCATVRVRAGKETHFDFRLDAIWSTEPSGIPPTTPVDSCAVHRTPMKWVLAPVLYGDVIVDNDTLFPNAWPAAARGHDSRSNAWSRATAGDPCAIGRPGIMVSSAGGPSAGAARAGWDQVCLECICGWNLRRSKDRWQGTISTTDSQWASYSIVDEFEFRAPAGLTADVHVDSCSAQGRWEAPGLTMEFTRSPVWEGRGRGDYSVRAILDDCASDIAVSDRPDTTVVNATLVSTPSSGDNVLIWIFATGKDTKRTVQSILGSVRFGKKAGP